MSKAKPKYSVSLDSVNGKDVYEFDKPLNRSGAFQLAAKLVDLMEQSTDFRASFSVNIGAAD